MLKKPKYIVEIKAIPYYIKIFTIFTIVELLYLITTEGLKRPTFINLKKFK